MLQPVQLFKILSDETRLAIVMLLRESGELCVCDICAATTESQPKFPVTWLSCVRLNWYWTVGKGNGFTTVSHPTCPHGPARR